MHLEVRETETGMIPEVWGHTVELSSELRPSENFLKTYGEASRGGHDQKQIFQRVQRERKIK